MTWVQQQLDDEAMFPSKIGVPFPKNFLTNAKTILKRLFRVYAHIYHQHLRDVITLEEEAHLNTSFKHFTFFIQEFNLVEKKELVPLQELIDELNNRAAKAAIRWSLFLTTSHINLLTFLLLSLNSSRVLSWSFSNLHFVIFHHFYSF